MNAQKPNIDRLPPHDMPAEQGVLGCILLSPHDCLRQCREKFQQDEVFYDLRHQTVWHVMVYLDSENKPVDLITVQAELKNRALLDQIGDVAYLNVLQDAVPSAANLPMYLDIVWEKYIFRRLVHKNTMQVGVVYDGNGADESYVARMEQQNKEWQALLTRGAVTPKHLKPPGDFEEEYYREWFDRKDDTYGFGLPFEFPMRMRPEQTTVMTGDNGSGKSTMLCYLTAYVATQVDVEAGEKVVMASMEMPPATTIWIMARQLLGRNLFEDTETNRGLAATALGWLHRRVMLYDFLGITDRNELMHAFEYAAERHNAQFFILDNLMKVGIADDDYAAQGLYVQRYVDFNMKHKTHGVIVVHENKGDGRAKDKVRGSKQITDAPNNVTGMKRNETKVEKLEELEAEFNAGRKLTQEQYDSKKKLLQIEPDGWFSLYKQRHPASQQNGRARLYFDRGSLRFNKQFGDLMKPLIPLPKSKT